MSEKIKALAEPKFDSSRRIEELNGGEYVGETPDGMPIYIMFLSLP